MEDKTTGLLSVWLSLSKGWYNGSQLGSNFDPNSDQVENGKIGDKGEEFVKSASFGVRVGRTSLSRASSVAQTIVNVNKRTIPFITSPLISTLSRCKVLYYHWKIKIFKQCLYSRY